ncbi:olfactory receptor 2D3-like [Pelodytes ibericus]
MESRNESVVTDFILLGLSNVQNVQVLLSLLFLVVYTTSLAGNVLLILAVGCDRRLHNSMYFFLVNLSFNNLCGPSTTVPKMLVNFLSGKRSISLAGCQAQSFFYLLFGESECLLLLFMAYDRLVAICKPLHYNVVMTRLACSGMATISWTVSFIMSLVSIVLTSRLTFCGPNVIDHYFCEVNSLIRLTCDDTSVVDGISFGSSLVLLLVPLLLILGSYCKIVTAIIRIQSGRSKAFSTCLSHLVVVTLFYGTAMFMYMRPGLSVSDKIGSVLITVITPTLNPLIYSLKNRDVLRALRKLGTFKSA